MIWVTALTAILHREALRFLGQKGRLVAALVRIVLLAIAAWFVGNRTHLEIGEPIEHRPGVDGAGVMAQQMVDFFATQIAGHVTDWHMMQRFFPGEMA